jgi:hypothetical protein
VAEKFVQAVRTTQSLLSFERALTGVELDHLEGILKECVSPAHADVNKDYQQQYGGFKFKNGKFPSYTNLVLTEEEARRWWRRFLD